MRLEHAQRIIDYYEKAHLLYFLFWHRRTFGLHYGLWEEGTKNRFEAIVKENEFLAELANVNSGDVVLDVGCGVGGSAIWVTKNIGAKVIGLNLVQKQLLDAYKIARGSKFGYHVTDKTDWVRADYHQIPFVDYSFDVIWSLESIEHATSIEEFVKEAHRVLKPGGRLIIAATLTGEVVPSDEQKCQLEVGLKTSGAFKDSKTAEEVEEIMREVGFGEINAMDLTDKVLPSAAEMTQMCRWGYPVAKALAKLRLTSPVIVMNNEWGLYQEGLFRSGVTEYNVILGKKL